MILLVGPSASGKTDVGKIFESDYDINKVVTFTTRPKRNNEIDGVDYFFLTKSDFLRLKEEGFFFETVTYNDNFYGTSKNIKDNTYLIVEPSGLKTYINSSNNSIVSFYLESSEDIRRQRMILRSDNSDDIASRIEVDSVIFRKEEVYSDVDFIIRCDNLTLKEVAAEVITLYKGTKLSST